MTCKLTKHDFIKDERGVPFYVNYYECKICGKVKMVILKKQLPNFMEENLHKRKELNALKKQLIKARNSFVFNLQQRMVLFEKHNSIIYFEAFTRNLRTNKKRRTLFPEYFIDVRNSL